MSAYRAYEVTGVRDFRLVERELVAPAAGQVRIRVEANGVCHSDAVTAEGQRPNPDVPVVPGHELVGVIDAIGDGVQVWQVGDRVGVGFLGGHCGVCDFCRRGDFVNCADQPWTGYSTDGGYAEVAYAKASGLVRVPDGLSAVEAAPLVCAGITVFTAIREINARPGALVAIQGIGGLGHLGIQQANKLGYQVAAIARGTDKAELAKRLGAHHYIDSTSEDPAAALKRLGGAAGIVATASNVASMSPLVAGLAPRGQLLVVGASPDPLSVQGLDLVFGTRTVKGSLTGTSIENEDNLNFAAAQGIRPMVEVLPLSQAPKAYEHMMSGAARFRVVLDTTR
ncbi:alcohol dehydrogenase catalytic domain-containing protein [Kutzneria sp. NPDC052558]|uniref:alcohol dehydrogenase catalytic domain-containing protein n=1 Tax=Kutzneria sp. NPDC052558 TaxID=3364121 RepID=UPI0037C8190F